MSEDFFEEVDALLAVQREQAASGDQRKAEVRTWAKVAIAEATDLAKSYASQLRTRGIAVFLEGTLSFKVMFEDGDYTGVMLVSDLDTGRLKILLLGSENGKGYTGSDHESFGPEQWKLSLYEERLKATVKEAIRFAPKHRGLAKA